MAQEQNSDSSLDLLWVIAVILIAFFVGKYLFGDQITWLYVKVREFWIEAITSVWHKSNLMAALRMLKTREISEISSAQLGQLSSDLRFFMFPIWGGIVAWFGYRAIKKNPAQRFNRKLTRQNLAKEMSDEFPWVLPAIKHKDLTKTSIDHGRWAMALTPLNFCKRYGLISKTHLDKRQAEKLFSSQLGKLWVSPSHLDVYTKALFACFAAQICRDKDGSFEALKQLAVSISSGNPEWSKSNEIFQKYAKDKRVVEIYSKHAYVYTVMIAMFTESGKIGIFPPNHFLWLRPINRRLWYVLNCTSRRGYFSEVSGIYAHYLAEKIAMHKIEYPYVKHAVLALEKEIQNIKFDPINIEK